MNNNKKIILKLNYLAIVLFLIIVMLICVIIFSFPKNRQMISQLIPTNSPTKLSKQEQETIYNQNKNNLSQNVENDINYIVSDQYGVYMPIAKYDSSINESEILKENALTYPEYGKPGTGNLILFAHNSKQYPQGYFTPFISNLKVGDIVNVITNKATFSYEIIEQKVVNESDVNSVFL